MLRKLIITVICCLSILALCAVPSFAATMSDREMAIEQISLCWQTSTNNKNVVSFASLTSLCAELNRGGYPCEIRFVSALNGYAILGTGYVHNTYESGRVYPLQGKYYSNIEGSIFYSPYQSDSLLSSISTYLSSISNTLSSFQSNVQKSLVQIYSKLSGISDSVSIGVGHLNSISNYLSSDLTTYIQDIASSSAAASSSLSQLSTKMDSVVDTLTTENGKNSLFYPITRRLDSIIASLGSSPVNTGSLRRWRVDDDTIGSLNYSDIGYDALSSLMETVTASYLDYQVVSGNTLYYLDSVDSLSIVRKRVGNKLGYFIQCVGKYRRSVNGINQFFDGVFYLTEQNGTIFYSSDNSSSFHYLDNIHFSTRLISDKLPEFTEHIDSVDFHLYNIDNATKSINGFVRTISSTLTDNLPTISATLSSFKADTEEVNSQIISSLADIRSFLRGIEYTTDRIYQKLAYPPGSSSSDLSNIENALSTIIDKMDNLPGSSPSDLSYIENALSQAVGYLSSIDRGVQNIYFKVIDLPHFLERLDDYYYLIASDLSTIINKMDNLPASVDNIVVNITEDNSAYNIFYVQDENGDKKSVTSVAGDSMTASGKLLQFLYKLIIGAAISDVDNSISGLNDFFFDNAPSGLGEGVTVWD